MIIKNTKPAFIITTISLAVPIILLTTTTVSSQTNYEDNLELLLEETTPTPTGSSNTPYTFEAILDGDQEVPSVTTDATGMATLDYETDDNSFTLNMEIDGLALDDITGAHIHPGAVGEEGGIIFDLGLDDFSENGSITFLLVTSGFPDDYEDDLLNEETYVNIHTDANPDGEIRGQLVLSLEETPSPEPTDTPTIQPTETPEPTIEATATPTEEATPTPTAEVTSTPTETPEATMTPTPTVEPTATATVEPTPTEEPEETATPTVEPTSTATSEPSPTPTIEETPTVTPTPTITPTSTPSQELFLGAFLFPGGNTVCTLQLTPIKIFGIVFGVFPRIICRSL